MFCITCFEYTNLFDTRIWFLLWQKIFLQVISFLLGIFLTTTEQIRLYISVEYFGAVRCWLSNMLVNKCRCVCVFQYVRVKCVCIPTQYVCTKICEINVCSRSLFGIQSIRMLCIQSYS